MLVMPAMDRDPKGGRILAGTAAQYGERAFEPSRAGEAAMGQQPVIADVDAHDPEEEDAENADR